MAEKLLEYARFKGNKKLSLVLSKSTDRLQEIVIRNQKQSSIYDHFNRARKIFEFHLALWASNSQIWLARGTCPLAQVVNLINNS